jgi:HAE1 family hydrophobic/amphiphilic exporter-1
VIGFNLLTFTQTTYSAFFFVTLKDWDQRKAPDEQIAAIQKHLSQSLYALPQGIGFSFPPPSIPGVGTSGGVTFMLEDRSGSPDPNFLPAQVQKFVASVLSLPGCSPAFCPQSRSVTSTSIAPRSRSSR